MGSHHDHHGHRHRDRFRNPDDLAAYLAKMESPDRAAWQKPDEVVAALGLADGAWVAEVGAGTGYFALRMARAVGAKGRVFAVDVEPRILEKLRERIEAERVENVTPVLGLGGAPLLPEASVSCVLMVGTFHHFHDGVAALRRIARSLKPGGRIANIDYRPEELPVGPPVPEKISREDFIAIARRAGLDVAAEHAFLPYQYFIELTPAG